MKLLHLSHIARIALMLVSLPALAQGKSGSEKAGDILQVLIPAAAYTTTFILDDEAGRTEFYQSFLATFLITHSLKYAVNKPRPDGNGYQSFPSGHTSAAFQGAAFLQQRYGLKYGLPAYLAATFVGYSRIEGESDKHDLIDVSVGAAIGILSNTYFTTRYKNTQIRPLAENGFYGITFSRHW